MDGWPSVISLNILGNVFYAIFVFVWTKFGHLIRRRSPALTIIYFITVIVVWAMIQGSFYYLFLKKGVSLETAIWSSIFLIFLLFFFLFFEFFKFWSVGIVGSDIQIKKGLNYSRALSLSKNNIKFLGIGASKLTNDEGFEHALLRCAHSSEPIKFLLFKPSNELLVNVAKRAKKDRQAYTELVLDSLRKIKSIKERRSLNIEIRFYDEKPTFRLMFIDEAFCLVSYNVFGEGDGSQLPQLHIIRRPISKRHVDSFYFAFDSHFNRIWEKAYVWDFKEYIE